MEQSEKESRQQLWARVLRRAQSFFPWASLVAGILGAVMMERSPSTSAVVLGAAGLLWVLLIILGRMGRSEGHDSRLPKLAQFVMVWAVQSLMQQCLFFVLPFYVLSASFYPGHVVFLTVLTAVCAATLWDPVYEKIIEVDWARASLQAFVAFVTVGAVLPIFGCSNRISLVAGAALAALGAPIFARHRQSQLAWKRFGIIFGIAFSVFAALSLIGASVMIPPAPLRVTAGGIGMQMDGLSLASPSLKTIRRSEVNVLYCASAIQAPRGLNDELIHRWTQDGKMTDEIPLKVRGGRDKGFRTFSKKTRFKSGRIGCTVSTASGQMLHAYSIKVVDE